MSLALNETSHLRKRQIQLIQDIFSFPVKMLLLSESSGNAKYYVKTILLIEE